MNKTKITWNFNASGQSSLEHWFQIKFCLIRLLSTFAIFIFTMLFSSVVRLELLPLTSGAQPATGHSAWLWSMAQFLHTIAWVHKRWLVTGRLTRISSLWFLTSAVCSIMRLCVWLAYAWEKSSTMTSRLGGDSHDHGGRFYILNVLVEICRLRPFSSWSAHGPYTRKAPCLWSYKMQTDCSILALQS